MISSYFDLEMLYLDFLLDPNVPIKSDAAFGRWIRAHASTGKWRDERGDKWRDGRGEKRRGKRGGRGGGGWRC